MAEQTEVKKFSATAVPKIQEDGHRISLEILAIAVQLIADGVISLFQTAAPHLFK